jgi:hypothetical protein
VEDFSMSKKRQSDGEMLKGTLDMMILRTLVTGDAHGHTIAKVIVIRAIGLVMGEEATAEGGTR